MPVKNPSLLPLFDELKQLVAPYAAHFTARHDEPGSYDLWSERAVVIDGRSRQEVFFLGIVVQKSYVGFSFMPAYAEPGLADAEQSDVFGPELLALLEGKSCFHIRKLNPVVRDQIEAALRAGYDLYVARGWVRPGADEPPARGVLPRHATRRPPWSDLCWCPSGSSTATITTPV